jgi:hypothetical protein
MCHLCSVLPDERKVEKERLENLAARLRAAANNLEALSIGLVKPHSKDYSVLLVGMKHTLVDFFNEVM